MGTFIVRLRPQPLWWPHLLFVHCVVALVVLFEPTLIEWAGLAGKNVVTYILTGLVGINFIIELALNLVLSSVIVRLIKYRMKGVA